MNPETLLKLVTENPVTSGLVASALAAVAGFFRPIMRALQCALVRRIDQAWNDEDGEDDHEERVRKAAERVRSSTRLPLPRGYVENRVRIHKSGSPPSI